MELKPGYMAELTVDRKTDFGYFLTTDTEDVLLHNNDVVGQVKNGDKVQVFLYLDHQDRLAATMKEPIISVGEYAWLEVVSVRTGHGVFMFNGISRDLFLSMDELPEDRDLWPKKGERLPVTITWDKRGRMMAMLLKGGPIEEMSEKAPESVKDEEVAGYVYHFLDEGALLLTQEGYLAFIHNDEMTRALRYGEFVQGRVQYVRPDGRVNVTLRGSRTERQEDDSEEIYTYLVNRGGAMPYTDKTPPEDIKARFQISKAAFKRALGKLMKEGKIEQRDGWTYQKGKK